jgi:hypothetical protein
MNPTNANEPAAPVERFAGLTKREAFAMHAPPVPSSFEDGWPSYPPRPAHPSGLSAEDEALLRDWDRDGCFDLPEHLASYQAQVSAWGKEKVAIDKRWPVQRQARWAAAHADTLLAELSKKGLTMPMTWWCAGCQNFIEVGPGMPAHNCPHVPMAELEEIQRLTTLMHDLRVQLLTWHNTARMAKAEAAGLAAERAMLLAAIKIQDRKPVWWKPWTWL